jgi:hypothetical protein
LHPESSCAGKVKRTRREHGLHFSVPPSTRLSTNGGGFSHLCLTLAAASLRRVSLHLSVYVPVVLLFLRLYHGLTIEPTSSPPRPAAACPRGSYHPGFQAGSPEHGEHCLVCRGSRSFDLPDLVTGGRQIAGMATRRNNRKGPRGRIDARTVESPVPGTSSTSDSPRYLKDPLEFIRVNAIRDRLQEVTVNNDRDSIQDRFITEHSLRKIWNGGLLTGLLEVLGYEDNGLVGDILMNLIKTISILVSIRWDEWPRFSGIFLEYRDVAVLRHDRKDRALPHPLQVLGDASFLGKSWAVDFSRMQSSFLPIIVEQGKNTTYPRTRPLPFIRSQTAKIATGAYGVVTKETIAKYQFLPLNDYSSRELHKVNNFRLSANNFWVGDHFDLFYS